MARGFSFAICLIVIAGFAAAQQASKPVTSDHNWPRWRGPHDTGEAPHADPPIEWSERKNVRWKVPIPGVGHSSPIVWGDRLFVTTAVPKGDATTPERHDAPGAHDNFARVRPQESSVLCISRRDGSILWKRIVNVGLAHEGGHVTGSFASASPVTDGEHVFAYFGSRGLYCLDLQGKLIWKKDLGKMLTKHAHGEGSSPVLHGESIVVNWDHEGQSFVAAFEKRTGKERWRFQRQEVTSWATPIVVRVNGKPQVIVSGTKRVRGYDLDNGLVIWECGGLAHNVVASPVAADGMVYVASSYEKQAMLALRLSGAKGILSRTDHVVWTRRRRTPYVPSPLLYGDALYMLHHYQGRLSRVVAKTGKEPTGPFRLHGIGDVYASPVGAADRVYITDRDGTTLVIGHEQTPRTIALNQLDDRFSASAAVVGNELFLRGEKFLYCIAKK